MRRQGIAMTMLGITVLTGCATASTAPGRTNGGGSTNQKWKVQGTFEVAGGPIAPGKHYTAPPTHPLPGVATFRDASGQAFNVKVGASGKFSTELEAATYTVTGRTPHIKQQNPDGTFSEPPCSAPVTAVVRPSQITTVMLVCIVP